MRGVQSNERQDTAAVDKELPRHDMGQDTSQHRVSSSSLSSRLEHWTWANYTFPMATGGLALLLSEQTQAYRFDGLQTIGKVVYIFDLIVFSIVTAAIVYRFCKFPGTLKSSITHPTEGLFLGTSTLSMASIIAGMARYGIPACGPWLVVAYRVLFWIYYGITFLIAVCQYAFLFTSPALKIRDMTPAWDLPIFPFMLSGTIAAAGAALQPPDQAVAMIIAGLTAQGLGMLISMCMYASYLRRMIQWGFPSPNSRAGMFIAVGPPSFTSLALIGMANDFPVTEDYFGDGKLTLQIFRAMATMISIFIWSLSLWFFFIALIACLSVARHITFHLNWWAFVFPNIGFTIAILAIGKTLRSPGICWFGTILSILIVMLWIFVVFNHVRAFIRKDIVFQGKDEDYYVNETQHGHVKPDSKERSDSEVQLKQA